MIINLIICGLVLSIVMAIGTTLLWENKGVVMPDQKMTYDYDPKNWDTLNH